MTTILHLRPPKDSQGHIAPGGVTIAYSVDTDNKVCYYAVAKCNPSDNFCRRTGRVKAEGRLRSPRFVKELKYQDEKDIRQILSRMYSFDGPAIAVDGTRHIGTVRNTSEVVYPDYY